MLEVRSFVRKGGVLRLFVGMLQSESLAVQVLSYCHPLLASDLIRWG
jgi:hypothetical protein